MQVQKRTESKLLDRAYVECFMEAEGGKMPRKQAIEMLAKALGVPAENIGLLKLEGHSGTTDVLGKFYVYGSQDSKKRTHPRYLEERLLSKADREKLKQERKKQAAPAAAPEAKK